jgi:Mg-chelatase subunit ChlD
VRKIEHKNSTQKYVGNKMNINMYESKKNAGIYAAEIKTPMSEINDAVHIALLLDVSSSMEGERLDALKNTLKAFLRCLSANDILTIITYSSTATVLCSYTAVGHNEMYWASLIDSLVANGNTNIEAAFSTLARTCQNPPHAIILLTDGNVNMGSSSARAILLPLEVNRGLYGTSIFTLGFGDDHNQIMLRDIALNTQGNYFYCDKAENLPQTFGSILGILRNRSIEKIILDLPNEYEWLERYIPNDKRSIYINFLPGDVTQRFVFKKKTTELTSAPYLSIQCSVRGLGTQHFMTFSTSTHINPLADAEYARLQTRDCIAAATNLLASSQTSSAIDLLEKQLSHLESNSEIVHFPEVMGLRSLILDLLDNMRKKGNIMNSSFILSQMTSITTSLATQRNSAFDSPALDRLYTTSAMRSQTLQVTAEYDSILQSKDATK